jgi:hypothetical protein
MSNGWKEFSSPRFCLHTSIRRPTRWKRKLLTPIADGKGKSGDCSKCFRSHMVSFALSERSQSCFLFSSASANVNEKREQAILCVHTSSHRVAFFVCCLFFFCVLNKQEFSIAEIAYRYRSQVAYLPALRYRKIQNFIGCCWFSEKKIK